MLARAGRTAGAALLFAWAGLAAVSPAAHAGTAPSRSQVLLTLCPSRASLRASLLAYADSVQPTLPPYAGEALTFVGQSYGRASLPDSAIACFRRAVATRGGDDERFGLSDALIRRGREGDLEAAIAVVEQGRESSLNPDACQARLAWAHLLAGDAKQSLEMFKPLEPLLDLDPVWGYRMARAFVEGERTSTTTSGLPTCLSASAGSASAATTTRSGWKPL